MPDQDESPEDEVQLVEGNLGPARWNADTALDEALRAIAAHGAETEEQAQDRPFIVRRDASVPGDA